MESMVTAIEGLFWPASYTHTYNQSAEIAVLRATDFRIGFTRNHIEYNATTLFSFKERLNMALRTFLSI
jgi:hypothetical protein